jgi:hypothetical protein
MHRFRVMSRNWKKDLFQSAWMMTLTHEVLSVKNAFVVVQYATLHYHKPMYELPIPPLLDSRTFRIQARTHTTTQRQFQGVKR